MSAHPLEGGWRAPEELCLLADEVHGDFTQYEPETIAAIGMFLKLARVHPRGEVTSWPKNKGNRR